MASRALLRRRKYIVQSLSEQFNTIQCLSSVERQGYESIRGLDSVKTDSKLLSFLKNKESFTSNLDGFHTSRLLQSPNFSNGGVGKLEFSYPLGYRSVQQSLWSSVATANKPDDDKKGEKITSQSKEASPEECDEAVEGLSLAKAKAKAKKLEESQKSDVSVMQRVRAFLLGIGPALRAIASMSREDWAIKLRHWKDEFKSTLQHYWLGTKLLWADVRISVRLLVKLANGKGLSRRERQQLTRTTADIFRLVPVAVFIIVPFMEFLLPVALKLFPNMLPSTFQDKMKEEEALKRRLNARMEYAKFLQDTVKEMAKEVQTSRSGEIKKTAEDLDGFMNKVRRGVGVSNDEILGFAKLFNDELTLDNINRPRLVNMCKYMGISPFGTDAYLRYMLRKRLQEIKKDDKLIKAEGVESLSEAELRQACRYRGMLQLGSVEEMRQQLIDWLDLSLNHSVPSSLLILSRSFSMSGKLKPEEAVQATLSSLPDEVLDTVGVTALSSEDSVSERKRKLEYLEMQEELIKEEEDEEEEEMAKMKESASSQKDVALDEMLASTAKDANEQAIAKTLEKHEQLCELSRALAVLASASSVSMEREEFLKLVKKEVDLYNSMVEKGGTDDEEEARKAYLAAREDSDRSAQKAIADKTSSALLDRVESMLQKLEKEIDDVDNKIGNRWRLLDRDYDGKVSPDEVASAAKYLKDTLGKEGIQELIQNLSKDKDGKILVEDLVKLASEIEDAEEAAEEAANEPTKP
ncbi:PREDICTED: LETM1 and EF-hand domain-containing protein 1, mitochondrial [Brassica oleracea var. oleracea]|uniref:Mitochondrial proton/calcium exchanger protein n=1 Tax=Brassica oleracea var. oleracea TaxID=109376 RepID=A0A0D3CY77_BRAOL|nr:PREDICTED: LETM1 and EF-hand domain-containing protein 1, mitochondrial [Brassica oleracea var. oleracea]XP_013592441.1 PREDICTED: LETM1 and EF-hand domain-containing protein 1, mitochondrial [Brassica oleracea var. oleracea]